MAEPAATPEEALAVQEVLRYYRTFIEFQRHHARLPGIQAAVYDGDQVASITTGVADLATSAAMTDTHRFRIASQSKTLTAVALMQLVEKGVLRLDDPVSQHLPNLARSGVGAVTLRELLSHTAGLIRDGDDANFWQLGREFPNRAELLAIAQRANALILGRQERFKYSNIGYGLVGLVLEAKTGLGYPGVLQSGIFDRLRLNHSGVTPSLQQHAEFATGYTALWYADHRVPIQDVGALALSPATGCYSTAADLVKFFAALLPGDTRLLADDLKVQLQDPSWESGVENERYGLGIVVFNIAGSELVGHPGAYPGHNTFSLLDRKRRIAVSVCVNAIAAPATGDLARAFPRLIALAESKPRLDSNIPLARFAGRFVNLTRVFDVAVLGGQLYQLNPVNVDPTVGAAPLDVVDGTTVRQSGGSGHDAFGEPITYQFASNGEVNLIRGPRGVTSIPLSKFRVPKLVVPGAMRAI